MGQWAVDMLIYILFRKEATCMIDLYCALIINGKRDIASIPERYQAAVAAQLAAVGLDENGNAA